MIDIPMYRGEMNYYDIGIPEKIINDDHQAQFRNIMEYLTRTGEHLSERLYNDRRQLTEEDKQYIRKMIKSYRWKSTRIFNKLWEYQNREDGVGYEPVM
jgi:hypothetical protein